MLSRIWETRSGNYGNLSNITLAYVFTLAAGIAMGHFVSASSDSTNPHLGLDLFQIRAASTTCDVLSIRGGIGFEA